MPNTFMNCALDESANQLLQDWYADVRQAEAAVAAMEATMDAQITAATTTAKTYASLTVGPATGRVTITAIPPGSFYNRYAFQFVASVYNQLLSVEVNGYLVTVYLATGAPIPILGDLFAPPETVSTPENVVDELNDPVYQLSRTFDFTWSGTDPVQPQPTAFLAGGTDAAIYSSETALAAIINTAGTTPEAAMAVTGTPLITNTDTAASMLAKISGSVQLASGKSFTITGTNLTEIRRLWALLSSTTQQVYDLLPGTAGTPVIVWTREVTSTIPLPDCDGGGTQDVTTTVVVGAPNSRATRTDLTPNVWWRASITPTVATVSWLYQLGCTQDQVKAALDASVSTTHVIEDPAITTTFTLTVIDLGELLAISTVHGIAAVLYEDLLNSLPSASAATGWNSPAWSLPGGPVARENLGPDTALADQVAALAASPCIDLIGKGLIATFVAAATAPIDMVTRVAERIRNKVHPILTRVSAILAKAQQWMDKAKHPPCIVGLDISFDSPQVEFALGNLKLIAPDIKGLIDTIEGIFKEFSPPLCKIQTAVVDLIGPLLPEELDAVCIAKGLTNLLVNKLGAEIKLLLPCINNPFDALQLLQGISDKITALTSLVNSMLSDLRIIVAQVNLMMDMDVESPAKQSMVTCQSTTLATLAKRIKSKFGV